MKRGTLVWLALALLLATTLCVYWPALHGGYFFDDGIYFVDNPDVHPTSLHVGEWWRAAVSQCNVNAFCRPLSALTFAANYYFSGLDPFWPKLTNLIIHLLNGVLVFGVFRELLRLRAAIRGDGDVRDGAAVALAGLWLLLPINFTGVAYVAQRMEELANLFVLLGLLGYLRERVRHFASGPTRGWRCGAILALCTLLGLSAKEDAALLPLYTACVEFAVTRWRERDARLSRNAIWTHVLVLLAPLAAGLAWIAPHYLHSATTLRDFTVTERLLTETRVLVDYLGWTLLPNLGTLTFFHDDVPLSHSLLDPPTTLAALLALAALLGVALWQRRARPLFCLGVLWYFAGHCMTGTIVPLEIAFEHRNYFPSLGVLLAAASLLALEPGLRQPRAHLAIALVFTAFFAMTTFLRAQEWSHPVRLAYAEATKRPQSQRAQYELARTLILAAGSDANSPLLDASLAILQRHAFDPDSGITALQALIFLNGRAHRPVDPHWWQALIDKLRARAPRQSDIAAVIFLYQCQQRGECAPQREELFAAFTAALERSGGNVNLTSAYADFALRELGDAELAERMAREAVAARPSVAIYRSNLIRILVASGHLDAADTELERLRQLDRFGSLDDTLRQLRAEIDAARAAAGAKSAPQMPQASTNR